MPIQSNDAPVTIPEFKSNGAYGLSQVSLTTNIKSGVVTAVATLTPVSETAWAPTREHDKRLIIGDLAKEVGALKDSDALAELQAVQVGLLSLTQRLAKAKKIIA